MFNKTPLALLLAAACAASSPAFANPAAAPAAASSTPMSGPAAITQFWWPNQTDLSPLRQYDVAPNPYGGDFDYAKAFAKVDLAALKADLKATPTQSQDGWPADRAAE